MRLGAHMENNILSLINLKLGTRKEILLNVVKYIKEYAGGISLITTAVIAIGSVLIKCFYYLFSYGYTIYFNVPTSMIDVSKENLFYSFLIDGIIAVLIILVNLIPYYLWREKKPIFVKISCTLFFVMSPNIPIVIGLVADFFRDTTYSVNEIIVFLLVGLTLGCMFFFNGIYYGVKKHRQIYSRKYIKKKKHKKVKQKKLSENQKIIRIILYLMILLAVESVAIVSIGYFSASSKNEFMIINDTNDKSYAVVYETTDSYIVTECKIDNNTITFPDLKTKKEIRKGSVEYSAQKLVQK